MASVLTTPIGYPAAILHKLDGESSQSTAGGASPLNAKRMYVGTLSTPVSQLS